MIKKLYLDVETTGLDSKKCGLTQVAYIIEIDGNVMATGNMDVRPFEGAQITAKALEVTGKTYEEIMQYPLDEEQFKIFRAVLKTYINPMVYGDDFTLIAYNAEFDQNYLIEWFDRNGVKYSNYINYRKVDTLAILRILHAEGFANLKGYKLTEVYKAVFDEEFDAHDALADIEATKRLHEFLVENYLTSPDERKRLINQKPHTEDMGK